MRPSAGLVVPNWMKRPRSSEARIKVMGKWDVAVELELSPRLQAGGGARMTGDEHQLAGRGTVEIDL